MINRDRKLWPKLLFFWEDEALSIGLRSIVNAKEE